jgi:two-component system response regulator DevR
MKTKPIKILIVEDSALVRIGIRSLLESSTDPRIEVIGEAASNSEAIVACDKLTPDIVLLDIRLSDGLGFEACKEMLKRQPNTRVIVLTSHSTDSYVYEAVTAGVHGYLMKEIDPEGLLLAIRDVAVGKSILAPDVTTRILKFLRSGSLSSDDHNELAILSPQEKRVLAQVAEGFTNKQIGAELNLSENTVKNYLIKVYEKLQVNRRAQAAAIYVQNTTDNQSWSK